SLVRIFILFPDPWPKSRHHKRRLIEQRTIASLARVMAPQSQLRIASDIADYQRWIMEHFHASEEFEWLAEHATDWRHRPADWPATRYEAKAIAAGRKPAYLAFRRR
ncbi:MAG: tRNA (guanosine(46)-N7)-methyltransferase TrmB, partial [Rhizobiales bacterium]|nr:tRNA (guanosine(46)-N7)-methyltransferase TrmB [Hyphomicrobiales bacterium]